jgi:hypothetical protein
MRRPGHSHRRVGRDQKTEPHARIERMGARGDRSRPVNWSRRSEDPPRTKMADICGRGAIPTHRGNPGQNTQHEGMRYGHLCRHWEVARQKTPTKYTPPKHSKQYMRKRKCAYATTRSQENTRKRLCVCHPNCRLCSSLSIAMSASILCKYSAQIVGQSQGHRRRDNPRSRQCQRVVATTATADARERCCPTERRG